MSVRKANVRYTSAIAHVHVQSRQTTYTGIVPDEYLASLNEVQRVPVWRDWLSRDIQLQTTPGETRGKRDTARVTGFLTLGFMRATLMSVQPRLRGSLPKS